MTNILEDEIVAHLENTQAACSTAEIATSIGPELFSRIVIALYVMRDEGILARRAFGGKSYWGLPAWLEPKPRTTWEHFKRWLRGIWRPMF